MFTRVAMALLLLAGCRAAPGGTDDAGAMSLIVDGTTDGGRKPPAPPRDVPMTVDRGLPRDGAASFDASPEVDAGARDAAAPSEVIGTPRDVEAPRDEAPARDLGVAADNGANVDAGRCVYEPVALDGMGDLRNAAGRVRECWPGEPQCFCDRDNDCYAQAGYVARCAAAARDAGVLIDIPTPRDLGTMPTNDPVSYSGSFPIGTGRNTVTLRVNGNAREVVVYVPPSRGAAPPLLLLFHGTNGSGDGVFTETDAQAVASANGAIVVAPSSRYRPSGDWDHRTEETFWETYPNADPTANEDLLLTRAVIVEARRAYAVDAGRVYALGHSNGAFFATLVASVLADRIAAFATSSGGLNRCSNTWSCSFQGSGSTCAALRARSGWCACSGAEKPVTLRADGRMPPGYLAHGTRDPLVSVQYTCELEARMQAVGATVQTALRDGDGHVLPGDFVSAAWRFLGSRRR